MADTAPFRLLFSGMKSNHKQPPPEVHLKNTFQADLDIFKRLFSETKNSRLMTPAKFNRLSVIEEDQSNEQPPSDHPLPSSRSNDPPLSPSKEEVSLPSALSRLNLPRLSPLQEELFHAMADKTNTLWQVNQHSGKWVMLQVLALTRGTPLVYVSNQEDTARLKWQGSLRLECHSKEEQDNRINRKLLLQEVEVLSQSFEMFLAGQVKPPPNSLIVLDFSNLRLLNQILVDRVNLFYKNNLASTQCLLLTEVVGRSMVMDLWEGLSLAQTVPKEVSIENMTDCQGQRLLSLDNVLHCKYEESQWKSVVALLREKQDKSKHPVVLLCWSPKEAAQCQRALLQAGLKSRLQKGVSLERGLIVAVAAKWLSQQPCSYVLLHSLPASLEAYLSLLQGFHKSTTVISLVSDKTYLSMRNQIQASYLPAAKVIALLQAILNPKLTSGHQVEESLRQSQGQSLLVHKLKDLCLQVGLEQKDVLRVVEYMNLVEGSVETYSLVPLSCQVLATQPIATLLEAYPPIRGILAKGTLVGSNSIKFKTIQAALDQDSDVNTFMAALQKGAKEGLYQLKSFDQLWFYKVRKAMSDQDMSEKAVQLSKAFNYSVYERRKQLDIAYLYQAQFSLNSFESLLSHLKYRGQCKFIKEKEGLLEEYLALKDNKEGLLAYLRHFQAEGLYKQKLPGVALSSQRDKSNFMQDVSSVLAQSLHLVNLTSYHILGDVLEKTQLVDVLANNLLRLLLGLHSPADHEHAKTLSLFGKYRDGHIQDMQVLIYELTQQFIRDNADFEDDPNFSGKALKKLKA